MVCSLLLFPITQLLKRLQMIICPCFIVFKWPVYEPIGGKIPEDGHMLIFVFINIRRHITCPSFYNEVRGFLEVLELTNSNEYCRNIPPYKLYTLFVISCSICQHEFIGRAKTKQNNSGWMKSQKKAWVIIHKSIPIQMINCTFISGTTFPRFHNIRSLFIKVSQTRTDSAMWGNS